MRASLLLVCALLAFSLSRAQITLDSMSYPDSEIGTDSLKVTTVGSLFPSFAPAASGIWDLGIITDSVAVFFDYRILGSYPSWFADSNIFSFAGYAYQGNEQKSVSDIGLIRHGISIKLSAYSLTSLTAGLNDSLIIPQQTISYSAPHTIIAFPATAGSYWSSTYQSDLNFQLTYLAGGDTSSPGIVRTYTVEKDSVTGWGDMRVKDAGGSPSMYLHVLQVQTMIVRTDSFFLKGAPFSTTMETFFGVHQGHKDTTYEQNYYRPLEVTPLAKVEFRDAAYTQPFRATTHVQRLQNVGVAEAKGERKIKVYPNPAGGRSIFIELPNLPGAWQYELTDVSGRTVSTGDIKELNSVATIRFPGQIRSGSYWLTLFNGPNKVSATAITINN